jgi:threonine dehydratase
MEPRPSSRDQLRRAQAGAAAARSETSQAYPAQRLIAKLDLRAARAATAASVVRTPTVVIDELAGAAGEDVAVKAECLQRTGSFKLRGALAKLAALGDRAAPGLVTGSAGNHGCAVAQAALIKGLGCHVFMPRDAPVNKVAAVEELGAKVSLAGASVEEALELASARAAEHGEAFVHPFDDLDVISGQGTIGFELLEDLPRLRRVIVPVGGGGLASGIGIALRRAGARVELVGVQARACAPFAQALAGGAEHLELASPVGATIADGIAVKRPGELTLALLRELLSDLVTVSEDEIADAIVFLAEHTKLVSEGAGAVALAALLSGRLRPVPGTTVAILSGGNVDAGLFAGLLRRHETEEGRRVRIFTRVADRPGGLAELLSLIAGTRANLLTLEHVRDAVPLRVRETGVELTLETRGPAHTDELLGALRKGGYEVRIG